MGKSSHLLDRPGDSSEKEGNFPRAHSKVASEPGLGPQDLKALPTTQLCSRLGHTGLRVLSESSGDGPARPLTSSPLARCLLRGSPDAPQPFFMSPPCSRVLSRLVSPRGLEQQLTFCQTHVCPLHTPHSEEGPYYPHLTDEETDALPKVTRLTNSGGGFKSRLPDTSVSHPPPLLPLYSGTHCLSLFSGHLPPL